MRRDLITTKIRTNVREKTASRSISPTIIADIFDDLVDATNHSSKSIRITADDIEACVTCSGATLEDKIAQYLNTLDYHELNVNGEVWVNYDDLVIIYVPFSIYSGGRITPVNIAHGGENDLPVIGDKIYLNTASLGQPIQYELYHIAVSGNTKASFSLEIEPRLETRIHIDPNNSVVTGITSTYTLIENSNLSGLLYHNGANNEPEVGDVIYREQNVEGGTIFVTLNSGEGITDQFLRINDGNILVLGNNGIIINELSSTYKPFVVNQPNNELLVHSNSSEFPIIGDTIQIYDRVSNSIITDASRLTNISTVLTTTENGVFYNYEYDLLAVITNKSISQPST